MPSARARAAHKGIRAAIAVADTLVVVLISLAWMFEQKPPVDILAGLVHTPDARDRPGEEHNAKQEPWQHDCVGQSCWAGRERLRRALDGAEVPMEHAHNKQSVTRDAKIQYSTLDWNGSMVD